MYGKGLKRGVSGALCAMLLFGSLTGCSLMPEKVTAEDLIKGAFPEDMSSIDADIDLSFACEMEMEELGVSGSMELAMDMDSNLKSNEDAGYFTGDMKVKMLGMSVDQGVETYLDYKNGVSYTYDEDQKVWVSDTLEKDKRDGLSGLDLKAFTDLELKEEKDGYQVTAALDYEELESLMGSGMATTGDFADMGDFTDMKLSAVLEFAKDKSLESISIQAEPGKMGEVDLSEFTMTIAILSMNEDVDVAIPDDVKEKAVAAPGDTEMDDMNTDISDVNDSANDSAFSFDPDSVNDDEVIVPGETEGVDDGNADANDDVSTENVTTDSAQATSDVDYGTYAGKDFAFGMDLNTFVSDGWVSRENASGIFVPFDNEKYKGANLYLYGKQSSIDVSNLESDGVYGYSMDVAFCGSEQLPDMTFGGLRWGASRDEIIAVYGEPDSEYRDANAIRPYILTYQIGTVTMELSVSDGQEKGEGVNGLSKVSVVDYSLIVD